jgi:alpha-amylase
VVQNLAQNTGDGDAYHGYWATDIYQVNTNFGSAADLVKLSSALHARGMYLMVDIAPNHMGYAGSPSSVDYSVYTPFNKQSYFHPHCTINDNDDKSVKQCWLGSNNVPLPDLRTEDAAVQTIFNSWIAQLVKNYTIDGLRIDTAKHVNTGFWQPFLQAAGSIYAVGEVLNGDPKYVCPYQNYMPGVLNYPTYYTITQAFQSTGGSISNLVNGVNTMKATCADTTLLGSFLENHDQPRFPSYTSDISLTKNAIAFTLLQDGIPIIYQGQEQFFRGGEVPADREALWTSQYSTTSTFYTFIQQINNLRNWAKQQDTSYLTYKAQPSSPDSRTIVMRKGPVVSVYNNRGTNGAGSFTLSSSISGFTSSQSVTEILTCKTSSADSSGNLAITITGGLPQVFYPTSSLAGSGICTGASTTTLATSTRPTSTSTTSGGASCTTATSVSVTFIGRKATNFGDTLKLSGSISQLGSWNAANAIELSAVGYTAQNPSWTGTVSLPAGTSFQYKFIVVTNSGQVMWEADPARSYTVPRSCASAVTVSGNWQS